MAEAKPTIVRQHAATEPKNRLPDPMAEWEAWRARHGIGERRAGPHLPHRAWCGACLGSGKGRAPGCACLGCLGAGWVPQLPLTVRYLCADSEERSSADARSLADDSSAPLRVEDEGSS